MDKDMIERLAKAAGYEVNEFAIRNPRGHVAEDERTYLERFATLVAEECAVMADEHDTWRDNPANCIAEAIRNRFQVPLIAAMRAHVASKFGDEVEIP